MITLRELGTMDPFRSPHCIHNAASTVINDTCYGYFTSIYYRKMKKVPPINYRKSQVVQLGTGWIGKMQYIKRMGNAFNMPSAVVSKEAVFTYLPLHPQADPEREALNRSNCKDFSKKQRLHLAEPAHKRNQFVPMKQQNLFDKSKSLPHCNL